MGGFAEQAESPQKAIADHLAKSPHLIWTAVSLEKQTSGEGESCLCTNDAGKWSEPICLPNNAGRKSWASKQTGALGNVASGDIYSPDCGAAAWTPDGHIVIALINKKSGSFGLAIGGVTYTSGSTVTPMLFFYRM